MDVVTSMDNILKKFVEDNPSGYEKVIFSEGQEIEKKDVIYHLLVERNLLNIVKGNGYSVFTITEKGRKRL